MERNILARGHQPGLVVPFLRALKSPAHGAHDFLDVEPIINIILRRVPDLEVPDAFGKIILRQLKGDTLEVFGVLHNRVGVGKPFQIVR
jgi:hypothetical protein